MDILLGVWVAVVSYLSGCLIGTSLRVTITFSLAAGAVLALFAWAMQGVEIKSLNDIYEVEVGF